MYLSNMNPGAYVCFRLSRISAKPPVYGERHKLVQSLSKRRQFSRMSAISKCPSWMRSGCSNQLFGVWTIARALEVGLYPNFPASSIG